MTGFAIGYIRSATAAQALRLPEVPMLQHRRRCMITKLLALLLMCAVGAASAGASPAADTAGDAVSAGKHVYAAQHCLRCHAIAGEGNALRKLDDIGSRLDAAKLRDWIIGAPAIAEKLSPRALAAKRRYAGLPAVDIDALVAYLQTLR
jgi:mono/diheme cytochrome c family protein